MRATEAELREALQACIPVLETAENEYASQNYLIKEKQAIQLRQRIRELLSRTDPVVSSGHCKEKKKPGGCQLHNLHCGYPNCDIKKE